MPSTLNSKNQGFSLIELITAIGLMAVIGGISIPIYNSVFKSTSADSTVQTIIIYTSQAQIYAKTNYHDSDWGIYIQSSQLTLFQGSDYLGRDQIQDLPIPFTGTINLEGDIEIIFDSDNQGLPVKPYTLKVTNQEFSKDISINSQGTIFY